MSQRIELLIATELALRLGVPVNTIYAWKRRGLIPFVQPPGTSPRYIEEDVRAWIEQHRKGPALEQSSSTERR